jgi:NADH-quinone oxidoreductase subunit H
MTALVVEAAIKSAVLLFLMLTATAYLTFLERRLLGRFQLRRGPNRVGPLGLLQPLADGIKLLFKEDFIPAGADRLIYWLAPAISMVTALVVYAVIPFGPAVHLFGRRIPLYLADVNVGILLVLAASSIGVYGIIRYQQIISEAERLGEHTGVATKNRFSRTPSAASRSMCGVRISGLP